MKRRRGSFKKVTLAVVSLVAVTLAFVTALPTDTSDARSNIVDMGLEAYYDREEDAGMISWGTPNKEEPYVYQAFSKKPEDDEFQSISATDLNREVRVLNVYPQSAGTITYTTWGGETKTVPLSASLERWMEEPNEYHPKGFGMGLISVDLVTQEEFNKNPRESLTDSKGEWDYDAVFFGATDRHNDEDLTEHSRDVVEDFIRTGRGLLYGHDTIDGLGNKNFIFGTLRQHGNIKLRYLDNIGDLPLVGSPTVTIRKEGLLTKFPWEIGEIGTNLTVPFTHTGGQLALGDIWMDFTDYDYEGNTRRGPVVSDPVTGKGTNNFYLTSWGNTAMIQTGHTAGASTPDEQKVFANTLFYLAQLTKDTSIVDRSAMDVYAPEFIEDKVDVTRGEDNIKVSFPEAIDPIKQYEYYVKATGQDTGRELFSEIVKTDNVSGLVGYSYVLDNSPNTQPDNKIEIKVGQKREIATPNTRNQPRYLHISAVDYQGNVSEPMTVDLHESFHTIQGNIFQDLDGNGVRNGEEPFVSNHQVSLVNAGGQQLYGLNDKPYITTTDNNGYYKFRVYKGGQFRLKVEPLADREFTNVPKESTEGELPNHVTDRVGGLTDVFTLTPDKDVVQRNAGFLDTKINYTIKHINRETGNRIAPDETGVIDGTREVIYNTSHLEGDSIDGYSYTGQYQIDDEPVQNGDSFTIRHGVQRGDLDVTYYYEWEDPNLVTKRVQSDDGGALLPVDSYTNGAIYTVRDANGNVTNTGLQINSSAIIDEREAPIAVIPRNISINIQDSDEGILTSNSRNLGNQTVLLNNEFLDNLQIKDRLGNSVDSENYRHVRANITNFPTSNFTYLDMGYGLGSTEEVRNIAIGDSGATLDEDEDVNYLGRWNNINTNLSLWTPDGVLGISDTVTGINNINNAYRVETTYSMDIYNILKHNYEPRIGSDGIEYYVYTGTELLRGNYQYDSEGNVTTTIRNQDTTLTQRSYLYVDDLKVGQYANAEGFNIENNKVAPIQNAIATEVFDDGGLTVNAQDAVIIENSGTNPIENVEDGYLQAEANGRTIINYYEELAYVSYHTPSEDVITQQAIPLGGSVHYVNPYEFTELPSYNSLTVNGEMGITTSDVSANITRLQDTGDTMGELAYTQQHSGFYVSEVDEIDVYEQTIPDATSQNKQYMEEVLGYIKEVQNPVINVTDNYESYSNSLGGSRYLPVGGVNPTTPLNYKIPVTFAENLREFLTKDVMAVGMDTGYPVYSHGDIINEVYKQNYKQDNGTFPSDSDKLITTNKGSMYLIPLNNRGQTLEDDYQVRLFVNNIGVSQTSLVDDKIYTPEKYLYGRGNNTIYSGQRKEVEVEDNFTADQMVGASDEEQESKRINGVRISNNRELNRGVLRQEE